MSVQCKTPLWKLFEYYGVATPHIKQKKSSEKILFSDSRLWRKDKPYNRNFIFIKQWLQTAITSINTHYDLGFKKQIKKHFQEVQLPCHIILRATKTKNLEIGKIT